MFFRAIAGGFKGAARRPGLVLLLWAWHTALALVAVVPFWSWLRGATELSPQTDVLLGVLQVGTLIELLQAEGRGLPVIFSTVVALVGLALLSNAFVTGGTLEVLTARGDERRLLHRFFRGAGHFFGRSLRLLAIATAVFVVVGGLTVAVVGDLAGRLAGDSEPGTFGAGLVTLLAVAVVFALYLLSLDFARVMLVAHDGRAMVATWLRAVRFVFSRFVASSGISLLFAILLLGTLGLGLWLSGWWGASSWGQIVALLVAQQALIVAQTGLRVWQLASEAELYRLATPPAAVVVAVDPEVQPVEEVGPPPPTVTASS